MTRYFLLCLFLLTANVSFGQLEDLEDQMPDAMSNPLDMMSSLDSVNHLGGKFGYNLIGDQHFISLRLNPEINLGKWGVGLDVPISVNVKTGEFRKEEFVNGVGALRMIRYVRYGVKKRDPVYVRVGDMTGAYIGYGLLVNDYTNSSSFERRKIGINTDLRFGKYVGLEALYSDLNFESLNFLAVRPYLRPLAGMSVPIIKTLEVGGTYVTDHDQTDQDGLAYQHNLLYSEQGITAYGADAGVDIINRGFLRVSAYAQYANLNRNVTASELTYQAQQQFLGENSQLPEEQQLTGAELQTELDNRVAQEGSDFQAGSGTSYGVSVRASILFKLLTMDARVERVDYDKHFTPHFFNAMYDINKDARLLSLMSANATHGIYGTLNANIIQKIRVGGSLMMPDQISAETPAMVTVNAKAVDLFDKITLDATYFKGNLDNLTDAIKLDDRSLAVVRGTYKLYPFLTVGVDYQWTWAAQSDGRFAPKNSLMPFFGFNLPLDDWGKSKEAE